MFRFKKLRNKKDIKIEEEIKSTDECKYDIYLEMIFYILKYGDVINLDIKNIDVYEYEHFLALRRILTMDGIRISISQWADWTISIELIDENENLIVAQSLVPNDQVNWENDNNFVRRNPKIIWIQKGPWQKVILDKLNYLDKSIKDAKKRIELQEEEKIKQEKIREDNKNKAKRNHFEDIYKK